MQNQSKTGLWLSRKNWSWTLEFFGFMPELSDIQSKQTIRSL